MCMKVGSETCTFSIFHDTQANNIETFSNDSDNEVVETPSLGRN